MFYAPLKILIIFKTNFGQEEFTNILKFAVYITQIFFKIWHLKNVAMHFLENYL